MNKKLGLILICVLLFSLFSIIIFSEETNTPPPTVELKAGQEYVCENAGGCIIEFEGSKMTVKNGVKFKVNSNAKITIEKGLATLYNKVELTNVDNGKFENKQFVAVATENCVVQGNTVTKGTTIIVNEDGTVSYGQGEVTSDGQTIVIPEGSTAEFTGNQILAVGDIQIAGLDIAAGSNLEIVAGQVRIPVDGSATINGVQINANTAYVVICNTAACAGTNYAAFTPTTITLKGENAFVAIFEEGNPYINMVPGSYVDATPLNGGIITISENKVSTQGAPGKLELDCAEIANGANVYTINGNGEYKVSATDLLNSELISTNLQILDYKGDPIIVAEAYTNAMLCNKCSLCYKVMNINPGQTIKLGDKTYTINIRDKFTLEGVNYCTVTDNTGKQYMLRLTPGTTGGYGLYEYNNLDNLIAYVASVDTKNIGYSVEVLQNPPSAEKMAENRKELISQFKKDKGVTFIRFAESAALEPGINRLIQIAKNEISTPTTARITTDYNAVEDVNLNTPEDAQRYLWTTYKMFSGNDY